MPVALRPSVVPPRSTGVPPPPGGGPLHVPFTGSSRTQRSPWTSASGSSISVPFRVRPGLYALVGDVAIPLPTGVELPDAPVEERVFVLQIPTMIVATHGSLGKHFGDSED